MLELIIGKDWTANTDEILRMVASDVGAGKGNRVLLVPELISHDMERRLCDAAGDTASRYAQVLSFTRIARRVADSVGRSAGQCLDNGGRVVAMAAAARQLHSRLKAYAAVETRPEFLTELVDAVDEFKRCCISAEDLQAASEQSEGALAQKLEELALLMRSYDALCSRGKRDPRDQMNWVLEQLEDSDYASKNVFYIDGFPDFTRQNLAVLEHFIRESEQVTVSLNCDAVDSKAMAFEKAAATAQELIRCAKRWDIPVKIREINPHPTVLEPVRERLFQGKIDICKELAGSLRLKAAESVYQECESTAEDVLALVRGGCRYRDISLVCTDMASYRPILGLVFRRFGIPVYLSGTDEILDNGIIVTLLSALESALEGFEQRPVLRYLRSVLSPLEPDICDEVENYAFIWGISGSKWNEKWENHPDGLSGIWTEEDKRRIARIEEARALAMTPLVRLRNAFREHMALAGQVRAVYEFLEEISFARRLDTLAQEMDLAGDNRSAQILNQLWEILLTALEQLYDVLGETAWDADAFQRLLCLLLSQYDVGTIPTVLDSVTAGPVTAMRCQRAKHLFVLGAAEGSLPGYGGSKGVLTDQERVALRKMGVPLTGGAMEGIQAEFAEIYGVFCGASESVTVSCASGQPSYIYRRLLELVGAEESAESVLGAAGANAFEAGAYLAKFDASDAAGDLSLADEYLQVRSRRDYDLGTVSRENIDGLYGPSLTLSASQVDRQAECRLSYFLKYGLRLRERKEAKVDPAEFGTYVHAVLENTARTVMDQGGFHQVSLEDTMALARRFSDEYCAEHFSRLDSNRMEYLFRRNVLELEMVVAELWEELSSGRYEPKEFELGFGGKGEMPAIDIPAKDMKAQLLGFVDRVDCYREGQANFFRVVDYKTGKKDFDYCDVFNGVGLQMLLYLFALEQEGQGFVGDHPIPGGVQYFPARAPYVSVDGAEEADAFRRKKEWVRRGLLLNDELSLSAMDPDEEMSRLCCKRKKDGTLTGDLADRGQFRQLKSYVFSLLGKMVDEIASGKVEPNPYTRGSSHSACAFCPYEQICHKESVEGRRNYKTMTAQRFWEEIDREVKDHG